MRSAFITLLVVPASAFTLTFSLRQDWPVLGGGCPAAEATIATTKVGRVKVLTIDHFLPQAVLDNFADFAIQSYGRCFSSTDGRCRQQPWTPAPTEFPGKVLTLPGRLRRLVHRCLGPALLLTHGHNVCERASRYSFAGLVANTPSDLRLRQRLPHVDQEDEGGVAAVLYMPPILRNSENGASVRWQESPLCLNNDLSSSSLLTQHERRGRLLKMGTGFYATTVDGSESGGLEMVTPLNRLAYDDLYLGAVTSLHEVEGYITNNNSFFRLVHRSDMRYNRIVAYPSNALHSGYISEPGVLSENPAIGRLTGNFFCHATWSCMSNCITRACTSAGRASVAVLSAYTHDVSADSDSWRCALENMDVLLECSVRCGEDMNVLLQKAGSKEPATEAATMRRTQTSVLIDGFVECLYDCFAAAYDGDGRLCECDSQDAFFQRIQSLHDDCWGTCAPHDNGG